MRVAHGGGSVARELGHPADLEVDLLVNVAEQRGKRVVQRVGQDEVPAMKVTPSTMASDVSAKPELVGQEALDGHVFHVRPPGPRACIRCRTELAVGSSSWPTTLPSARNTTRSA